MPWSSAADRTAWLPPAGWDVLLLEANDELGGAVRSGPLGAGHVMDRYSSFYPLAAVSPTIQALELESHGLRWCHAPSVLAHPEGPDSTESAVIHRDAR